MSIDRLENLFHPDSVAVVGASARTGSVGRAVMQNMLDAGFEGPVYPVNPGHSSIMGKKTFAALDHIGEPVDLVIVATPMETVPSIIAGCSRIGAAGAVIISAGGKETGRMGRQSKKRSTRKLSEPA
jgi:acetyltransferase